MKALVIANRAPAASGPGDAVMAANVVRSLRDGGYAVQIVSGSGQWKTAAAALRATKSLGSCQPLQLGATYSRAVERAVAAATSDGAPELIVAVHARAAQYVPPAARSRTFAMLIDSYAQNYLSYSRAMPAPWSWLYGLEGRRMEGFEAVLAKRVGRVGVVSPADQAYLANASGRAEAVVYIPLPVDFPHFSLARRMPGSDAPLFVFTGRLSYLPNQDAARRLITAIWPSLRRSIPGSKLLISGANPSRSLQTMARRHQVKLVANPTDLRPLLAGATAMIVPMRMGGGVQNKVLEAIASRLPVICSTFANRGIGAEAGRHLLLADTTDEFVRQALVVVNDPNGATARCNRALEWAERRHSFAAFAASFLRACGEITHNQTINARRPIDT